MGTEIGTAGRRRVGKTSAVPVLDVSTLTGDHVVLEPLRSDHVDAVTSAGVGDRSTFELTQVPDGQHEAMVYVSALLDDAARGRCAPFVQIRRSDGLVVGCTRYLDPHWWLGRDHPDEVEIGGTWLCQDAQRTAINTEAKRLLLSHAFEVWGVQRVALCTDARNDQSRRAIERIGASFEGVMRRHRRSTATTPDTEGATRLRDTATYSIIVDDWPTIRASLARSDGA